MGVCWHRWEKAKAWAESHTIYIIIGYECSKCNARKIKEIYVDWVKPHLLDAAVEWRKNRPQKSTILKLVKK